MSYEKFLDNVVFVVGLVFIAIFLLYAGTILKAAGIPVPTFLNMVAYLLEGALNTVNDIVVAIGLSL